jgi:hypothetical protein
MKSLPSQASQPGEPHSSLRVVYGGLALLASIAATKAMVWPLWPKAEALQPAPIAQALQRSGFVAQPMSTLPASRTAELATSAVQTFALGNGLELRLMNATVRERFNLQTAFVGRIHPEIQLKTRQPDPQVGTSFIGSLGKSSPPKKLAEKEKQTKPRSLQASAAPQLSRQTCLVAGPTFPGGFGATRDQLTQLTDQMAAQESQRRWQVLLGLKRNRDYRCTLISVRSDPGQPAMPSDRWQKLLTTLQGALNRAGANG